VNIGDPFRGEQLIMDVQVQGIAVQGVKYGLPVRIPSIRYWAF
jgi:hypothetical protein